MQRRNHCASFHAFHVALKSFHMLCDLKSMNFLLKSAEIEAEDSGLTQA